MEYQAHIFLAGFATIALLAGCGSKQEVQPDASGSDPALVTALGSQIMVDPQLVGKGGAAVDVSPDIVELPPEQRSPETIAAAKAEAANLAGGMLKQAPAPVKGPANPLLRAAVTAAQVAEAAKAGRADCSGKVAYSMNWVSSLPTALPVYPRGAVQEAAGTDKDGCSLRVVNFVTPVAPGDVMDFYYTRLRAAGYSSEHRMDNGDQVLGGNNGKASYLVFARKLANGLTEVDLVASGR